MFALVLLKLLWALGHPHSFIYFELSRNVTVQTEKDIIKLAAEILRRMTWLLLRMDYIVADVLPNVFTSKSNLTKKKKQMLLHPFHSKYLTRISDM